MRIILLLALSSLSLITTSSFALVRTTLSVCGDGASWPPYHFAKDGKVIGYDVDILDAIFKPLGVSVDTELPPWQRCLYETQAGRYDIALSAAYSEDRDRDYILTDYYYTLQPSYVYSSITYPDGLPVNSAKDLDKLRVCGLRGYNYTAIGVDDSKVRKNANNYGQAVRMLEAERCDVFLARYEILVGFNASEGIDHLANGLKAVSIPGISGDKFYMLISRAIPDGEQIKATFNTRIQELRATGELDVMINKYLD